MILLDTHVLVHFRQDDKKLGKRAIAAIERALEADALFVSAISFWEIAILVARGRIDLATTAAVFRDRAIQNGVKEIPIDGLIAVHAAELPDVHGDPADRILVASAIYRGLMLLTADSTVLDWKLHGLRLQDATD